MAYGTPSVSRGFEYKVQLTHSDIPWIKLKWLINVRKGFDNLAKVFEIGGARLIIFLGVFLKKVFIILKNILQHNIKHILVNNESKSARNVVCKFKKIWENFQVKNTFKNILHHNIEHTKSHEYCIQDFVQFCL